MRSRYSAFALGLVDYLIETTDQDGPAWRDHDGWREELVHTCETTHFVGLEISAHGSNGDSGFVIFHARIQSGSRDALLSERSRFMRHGDRWLYHGGDPA